MTVLMRAPAMGRGKNQATQRPRRPVRPADSGRKPSGLTRDEEQELALRIAEGDFEARDELVLANTGLVVHLVARYQSMGLDRDDLIGEGLIGLIRAAELFSVGSGRFSTFASHWIRQSFRRALNFNSRTIRPSQGMIARSRMWVKTEGELAGELGYPPSPQQVAERMRLSPEQASNVLACLRLSEGRRRHDDPEGWRIDMIPDRSPEEDDD
jgi:RNA polymerase primary sigma factor